MLTTGFLWRTLFAGFTLVAFVSCTSEMKKASGEACIAPKVVAGYIHAIIEADRTLYASLVVERMQHYGKALASQDWAQKDQLPVWSNNSSSFAECANLKFFNEDECIEGTGRENE